MKLRVVTLFALACAARAQSVYIDVGPAGSAVPQSTFAAAAAAPGVWNLYVPLSGGAANLLDVNGVPTTIGLSDSQPTPTTMGDVWSTPATGDFGELLDDGLQHSVGGVDPIYCNWYLSGIPAGRYWLHMFGYRTVYDTEFQVFAGSNALTGVLVCISGGWLGHLVEGRTHVTAALDLTGAASTTLRIWSAPWGSFSDYGAVAGFQLERMPDCGDAPAPYCTAGLSTHGCTASIGATGVASASAASGFDVTVSNVEGQRSGMVFYGVSGPSTIAWNPSSSSLVCVAPARQRTGIQVSGGTDGACDGTLTLDWNAFRASHPAAVGQPFTGGETIFLQAWYRDGAAPGKANLSNALAVPVCP